MSGSTNQLDARLARLALDPSRLTKSRLWKALSVERRETAAAALLRSNFGPWIRTRADSIVATQRHFRPQIVASWPLEKIAKAIARVEVRESGWTWQAIVEDQLANQSEMLCDFLDQTAVPHSMGRVDQDDIPAEPIELSEIVHAADRLADRFSIEDIAVYFLALQLMNSTTFKHTADWLRLRLQPGDDLIDQPITPSEPEQPESTDVSLVPAEFTTLDRRLTQMIVDAAADVIGAATSDEVDDMLLEIEKLNGRRHQTFFHCGFRDALFGRTPTHDLAAENAARWRWYASGYVVGVARTGDFAAIARLYDEERSVREIVDEADGATSLSAPLLFRALCDASRFAEAAALARPNVVARSTQLRKALFDTSITLIRESRASDARALLEILWAARPTEEGDDDAADEDDSSFWLSVKRRRALCFRQLGDQHEATLLLNELVQSSDSSMRSIALTDLGLIQTGVCRLGDLTLPKSVADRAPFLAALERGESLFRRATEAVALKPAHAQFALGVLALMREDYVDATRRLDPALSFFARSPEVYRADGSLALAELYLGIALFHSLEDVGRLPRASELICSALAAGARLPSWLVRSTIDSLALARSDLVPSIASALLASDNTALDELIDSSAGPHTPALASALFARATSPSRGVPDRAADYMKALPLLLADGSIQQAADALDYLEEQATAGIRRNELIVLLSEPANFSPAWRLERATEARALLLESDGRFDEAAGVLEKLIYQLLSQSEAHALDSAELLVGHIEGYGTDFADLVHRLGKHLEAKRTAADALTANLDVLPVDLTLRILVVGGNELQSKMDASIVQKVKLEFPNVEIEFLHSGWNGNWKAYADDFDRRVRNVDGIVMLAMIRTMLGRTVRHNCPVPWRGCRGRGQGQIAEAIRRLLPFASHQRRRLVDAVART
ncbi:MAG: hypothetical protein ABJF01_19085 [bacterium]